VNEQNFAEVLERRLRKIAELEKSGKMIEGPKAQVEANHPLPRLADRRYRRFWAVATSRQRPMLS